MPAFSPLPAAAAAAESPDPFPFLSLCSTFKFGVADRGSSIRIPLPVQLANKGYLEDRRPAANVE